MNERIKAWCYHCGHVSAFEIKGTCIQKFDLFDKEFPVLTFIQRKYAAYTDELIDEKEVQVYPDQLRDQIEFSYTFQREWTLMQCVVCSQPTLTEKETLDEEQINDFNDLYGDHQVYDEDPVTSEFKEETYTLYPIIKIGQTPPPDERMPSEVADIFNEARTVFSSSPRASAALLRFALELFLKQQGHFDKSIDNTLKNLEQNNLLNPRTIQACDSIRVFGNNGAHPLEINLNEDPDIALNMFSLLNFVVADIANLVNVEKMHEKLPESAKNSIKNRPLKGTKNHQSNHH